MLHIQNGLSGKTSLITFHLSTIQIVMIFSFSGVPTSLTLSTVTVRAFYREIIIENLNATERTLSKVYFIHLIRIFKNTFTFPSAVKRDN